MHEYIYIYIYIYLFIQVWTFIYRQLTVRTYTYECMYVKFVSRTVVPCIVTSTLALENSKKCAKKVETEMDKMFDKGKLTRVKMQYNDYMKKQKEIIEKSSQISLMIDTKVIMSIKIDLAIQGVWNFVLVHFPSSVIIFLLAWNCILTT